MTLFLVLSRIIFNLKQLTLAKDYKTISCGFNMKDHDWHYRLKQANKFIEKGFKVKFQMMVKGRQNALVNLKEETIKLKEKLTNEGFKVINAWTKGNMIYAFVTKK